MPPKASKYNDKKHSSEQSDYKPVFETVTSPILAKSYPLERKYSLKETILFFRHDVIQKTFAGKNGVKYKLELHNNKLHYS